jgi:hypothetical protein
VCWQPWIAPLSDAADQGDVLSAWTSLPRRIYLDTSTLQKLYDFGGEIFEGEAFEPVGRAARVQGLADEIEALRMIFAVKERAMFEFVVTEASLREVHGRDQPGFTQWVYDVLDTWLIQSEAEEPPTPGTTFDDRRFGMISVKDRRLLQEALDWRCQAFMTMERKLPTAAAFIERETGLHLCVRPRTGASSTAGRRSTSERGQAPSGAPSPQSARPPPSVRIPEPQAQGAGLPR